MQIVFMGTPDFAVGALEALITQGHEITAVVTQPDKPKGRSKELQFPPVKECAVKHGIPVFQPRRIKTPEAIEELKKYPADIYIVAAFGQILSQEILDLPKYGCLNIHASLLPKYRGASPIQRVIIDGEAETGVTIMQMNAGLDTGDMLLTSETPVGARETAGELFDRLAQSGAELLTETLVRLDEITPRPQNDAESCYAHMLDKKMAVIDWSKSARELDCLVRGLNPWPIALTSLAGERLKVYAAEPADGCGEPGTVLEADPKKGLTVACGEGALTLTEIQLVGGKRMKATDFLRGHAVEKGSRLGE